MPLTKLPGFSLEGCSATHEFKPSNRTFWYAVALHGLKEDERLRVLKRRAGIDFVSNDYLALASAPRMKRAILAAIESGTAIGAGGSRLLRGNCKEHERLEKEAAKFSGQKSPFSSVAVMCEFCCPDNAAAAGRSAGSRVSGARKYSRRGASWTR